MHAAKFDRTESETSFQKVKWSPNSLRSDASQVGVMEVNVHDAGQPLDTAQAGAGVGHHFSLGGGTAVTKSVALDMLVGRLVGLGFGQ